MYKLGGSEGRAGLMKEAPRPPGIGLCRVAGRGACLKVQTGLLTKTGTRKEEMRILTIDK